MDASNRDAFKAVFNQQFAANVAKVERDRLTECSELDISYIYLFYSQHNTTYCVRCFLHGIISCHVLCFAGHVCMGEPTTHPPTRLLFLYVWMQGLSKSQAAADALTTAQQMLAAAPSLTQTQSQSQSQTLSSPAMPTPARTPVQPSLPPPPPPPREPVRVSAALLRPLVVEAQSSQSYTSVSVSREELC